MAPPPRPATYSIVGLKRWSCKSKEIPSVADIKHLHVYDFDNTLFSSPLPNPQLWAGPTLGYLQTYECFASGGWWHDSSILSATGEGAEKEEPKAWKGWWNESIVQLVELSIKQKDALTVLLTGRGETHFAELVKRIADSKGLDFDLVCLKPEIGPNGQHFNTTAEFKNEFLKNLVFTYKHADEMRIYEDRPKHVKHFREYFEKLNKSLLSHPIDQPPPPRKPITADVIQVAELNSYLDPVVEASTIQAIINKHNVTVTKGLPNPTRSPHGRMKITSSYIYFGYLINPTDSARLITLANIQPPSLVDSSDIRLMANSILIAPRPPNHQTLNKVGGKGKKVTWQVTGTANLENKIWAVRVAPVPETEKYYTNDPVPIVVLAVRKGARPIDAGRIQNWQPVPPEKAFIFETVVGDKQTLRIDTEDSIEDRYDHRQSNRGGGYAMKRKFNEENGGYHGGKESNGLPPRGEDRDMIIRDRNDGTWMPQDRGPGYTNGNSGGRHGGRGGQFNTGNHQNDNNDGRRYLSTNRGGAGGGNQGGRGSGGGRGGHNSNSNNSRRNDYNNSGGQGGGQGQGPSNRGRGNSDRRDRGDRGAAGGGGGAGGGRGRSGGNRGGGPPGYKSLDDYGPGGYDGSNEYSRGPGGGGGGDGQMVMNY